MKGFLNPQYPMSNCDTKFDQTWGGSHPRLRAGTWYPKSLLPHVLKKRDRFVGTTSTDDEIGKVDMAEASKYTGSPAGFMFDPPEFRFLKGDWIKEKGEGLFCESQVVENENHARVVGSRALNRGTHETWS